MFFCLGSFIVFPVLLSGWSSNSKYSLIGRLRSVAQSISYESVFSTILVLLLLITFSFSIRSLIYQSSFMSIFLLPLWFICTLAETHRAPFDFRESESELVSGFNTEYSGIYFAFLFLSEYGVLLFSCVLMSYIFVLPFFYYSVLTLTFFSLIFSFIFI
jgi:NADH:ubiquinone oxidoreductase subunit H